MAFDFSENFDELLVPGSAEWKQAVRNLAVLFIEAMKKEMDPMLEAVMQFQKDVLAADVTDEQSLVDVNGQAHALHVLFELICGATGGMLYKLYHVPEGKLQEPPAGQSWN